MSYRKYSHFKSGLPPARITLSVDPKTKEILESSAKSRGISTTKVINEILEEAVLSLEVQPKEIK